MIKKLSKIGWFSTVIAGAAPTSRPSRPDGPDKTRGEA